VHLDRLLTRRATGYFIEVKSRTWSRRDARDKAAVIADLLAVLGASPDDTISDGYADLAAADARVTSSRRSPSSRPELAVIASGSGRDRSLSLGQSLLHQDPESARPARTPR
jgi:hypothetical protein